MTPSITLAEIEELERVLRISKRSGFPSVELNVELCSALLALARAAAGNGDDGELISEEWLRSVGFARHSLRMSILLPPWEGGAIVEMSLSPDGESDNWLVDLTQGVPDDLHRSDDHVLLTSVQMKTRGDVRRLTTALNIPLREASR